MVIGLTFTSHKSYPARIRNVDKMFESKLEFKDLKIDWTRHGRKHLRYCLQSYSTKEI